MYFLCVPKESIKEKPKKPLLTEFVRSPRENPLAINSLHCIPLRQNCSFFGFSLGSLTGFKGTPLGLLPSYSIRSFEIFDVWDLRYSEIMFNLDKAFILARYIVIALSL